MRIYTKAGDLAFKTFTFPDGQPHFKLETIDDSGFTSVTIETAIKSPSDLFQVLLVSSVLREQGFTEINLDIRYLLGARMDRAISATEPFTLQSVARIINGCGFAKVRILDAHSEVATRLIRNSTNVLPVHVIDQVTTTLGFPTIAVSPDKGARERVQWCYGGSIVYCEKTRDPKTGVLSGFKVKDASLIREYPNANFLIVDDICDGGGTFVGLAKELRAAGAKKVFLFVTHGIFSKGFPLEGIDKVFTTDSYTNRSSYEVLVKGCAIIPVSMKEMK